MGLSTVSQRVQQGVNDLQSQDLRGEILESLAFSAMNSRREMIPNVNQSTFAWVFDGTDISFMEWLEAEPQGNVYWIAGKAGSGKSTLMKHLRNDPQAE